MAQHVLVADDDEHIRFQIVSLLRQRGYTVDIAVDGKDAIARAIENPPDLLITDVMMPKLDGWSLVRELRSHPRHADLPVIFLTALSSEDDKLEAFRLGADDYVMKPFRIDDLAKRVARALSGRRTPARGVPVTSGLRGDLAQVQLSTLLVLVEMERKTGVLQLRGATGQAAEITLREGKVLRAEMRGAEGLADAECIYQLLRWKTGEFDFEARAIDVPDRVQTSTTALLMESARRVDEESQPIRLPVRGTDPAPAHPAPSDDDALAEWGEDERTPMIVAAKLAQLVRRTARATLPPIRAAEPEPQPAPAAAPAPAPAPAPAAAPAPAPAPAPAAAPAPVPATTPPPSRRTSPLWLLLAVLLAAAGTALPFLFPTATSAPAADISAALPRLHADASELSTAIDAATTSAKQRASTLATTPLLRAGIDTDAATLQDLAKNEALFVPVHGETIEVFQLHDGAPSSLLRLPAGAPQLRAALDETTRLETDGRAVTVIASAPVPRQGAGIGGVLAVATPCDLAPITRGLADHTAAASLTGLDKPVVLVAGDASAGQAVSIPLAKPGLALAATIATAASAADASPLPLARYALWGAGGLLLLVYVGLALARRGR